MLVVPHGVPVGEGADLVLEHLLVDAEVRVGVEVVVLGRHLLGGQVLQLLVTRLGVGVRVRAGAGAGRIGGGG